MFIQKLLRRPSRSRPCPALQQHSRRPTVRIWLIGVAVVLVAIAGSGLIIWDMRERAIEDVKHDMNNLGSVLAEQTARYIQVMDLLLLHVQSRSRDDDIHTAEAFRQQFGTAETHEFLRDQMVNLPQASAITLIDTGGRVLNSSRNYPVLEGNVADRDYFQHFQQPDHRGVFVSEPVTSRFSGERTVFLARRIDAADGTLLGLAISSIDLNHLVHFYRTIGVKQQIAITLLRSDGIILARHPPADDAIGKPISKVSPWYERLAAGGGPYRSPGYVSGHRSIVSVNPVPGYPFVVDASIRDENSLADWRDQSIFVAGETAVVSIVLLVLFALIARLFRQQAAQNAELRQTAVALTESENRLRGFAEIASDWFWEQDADLRFTWISSSAPFSLVPDNNHLGLTRRELIGNGATEERWRAHEAVLAARLPFRDFRYHRLDNDGERRHISIHGDPIFDSTGTFLGYRGVGRDITEQIDAEQDVLAAKERAERAEALLRDAVDSIAEGFVIFDQEDRLVMCNERFRQLYPVTAEKLIPGVSFEDALRHGLARGEYSDAVGREEEWLRHRLQRHREATGEAEQPLGNGAWILVTERRMRSGGIAGLRIDITALKAAQAALSASEARLDRAQEIAGIGSWELDLATGRYLWSRQMYRMRGLSPETFSPALTNLGSHVHPDDDPDALAWIGDLRTGVERGPLDFRIVRPDGQVRMVRAEGRPVRDSEGMVRRLTGTMQDITDQRLIEHQLAQAQKMEAIGQLTGGMAHDFNNVLGVVIGNLELLRRLITQDPVALELCDEARGGAQRCADLVRRLLAFARRQPLRPQPTYVNELIEGVGRLLGRTLGEDVQLVMHLDAAVWQVVVDPPQLEAALTNLATNARDAMPKGGRLEIATGNRQLDEHYAAQHADTVPGDYVLIEVSDTGTGIPPDVVGRIFEPFFTTKEPGHGTGLGLSMVFGFVRQSGGHITVYSEPGHGTTFRLYLPRSKAPVTEAVVAEPTKLVGGSEKVLVVEDNAQLRRAVVDQLTSLGYVVVETETADAALVVLREDDEIDLLFSDIIMPGELNGLDLAEVAVAERPGLKVLLTSGFPGTRGEQRIAGAPNHRMLNKPYRHRDLARMVRDVLDGDATRNTPGTAGAAR